MKKLLASTIQVTALGFSYGVGFGLIVVAVEKIPDAIEAYKAYKKFHKKEV
jgi:hypothetical protein